MKSKSESSPQQRRDVAVGALSTNLTQYPAHPRVDVVDPFTGQVIAQVAQCGAAEVDLACRTAQAAFDRGLPQFERALILDRLAQLLVANTDRLATVITLETGKVLKDARGEVGRAVETARFSAAEARTLSGEVVATEATPTGVGKIGIVFHVPLGVVAAITPFNFPLNTVLHKIAPAIAAGCSVVLKPAHQTPLSAFLLKELLVEAGMPQDWLTIVTDDGTSAGPALVDHPIPKLITFTGSTGVGWGIAQKAFRKRVALELGSNAPVIIERDADVDDATTKITRAAYSLSGQSCISVQRVLVHSSLHAAVLDALAQKADALVVGDPLAEESDLGPLILPAATQRVKEWIDEAEVAGGRIIAGGMMTEGCLRPTVVDGAPLGTRLREAEAFGPVLTVIPYETFDEAIAVANETVYGLQAGIFTRDLDLAMRASRELEFGGILINDIPTTRLDQQPYGGLGESGNTREGPGFAVREMTELRFVSFQASSAEGAGK
ncbi:aldehyde dehydrogenase family protein [Glaciibacter superstes]|uniref:aldehyde dehydrogenase family protein n=1 Tax=Glaciibacter superstes TaxID=501023 RepID=UPI0003B35050|nr:aldehyde dehydrogenase family protein [Glaciibacter superstes]